MKPEKENTKTRKDQLLVEGVQKYLGRRLRN